MKLNKDYITWVCYECGSKYCNNKVPGVATWHTGLCDICNRVRGVTEPRDFGGLKEEHTK